MQHARAQFSRRRIYSFFFTIQISPTFFHLNLSKASFKPILIVSSSWHENIVINLRGQLYYLNAQFARNGCHIMYFLCTPSCYARIAGGDWARKMISRTWSAIRSSQLSISNSSMAENLNLLSSLRSAAPSTLAILTPNFSRWRSLACLLANFTGSHLMIFISFSCIDQLSTYVKTRFLINMQAFAYISVFERTQLHFQYMNRVGCSFSTARSEYFGERRSDRFPKLHFCSHVPPRCVKFWIISLASLNKNYFYLCSWMATSASFCW